jgi:hypothetical protein
MTRLTAVPAALAAVILLAPDAFAKVPDPRFSQFDQVVVGDASGGHSYRVAFRDVSNAPLAYREVTLDFSNSPVRLYAAQEAGVTLNCAARTLTKMTGLDGVAIFRPRFGGACAGADVGVTWDGWAIVSVSARSTDMDGVDGSTGLSDLALFGPLLLARSTSNPEADFDGSGGAIDLADFVLFSRDLLSGAKGIYCP